MSRSSRRKVLVDTTYGGLVRAPTPAKKKAQRIEEKVGRSAHLNTIPEGEHDELVHIPAGRITWCLKVWPLECRTDGRYLRTHTNQHLVTCPDCQARLVASILERQP